MKILKNENVSFSEEVNHETTTKATNALQCAKCANGRRVTTPLNHVLTKHLDACPLYACTHSADCDFARANIQIVLTHVCKQLNTNDRQWALTFVRDQRHLHAHRIRRVHLECFGRAIDEQQLLFNETDSLVPHMGKHSMSVFFLYQKKTDRGASFVQK